MNTKKFLATCALTAAALTAPAGAMLDTASAATGDGASAKAGRAGNTVTIRVNGSDLSGKVYSPRRSCKANRTVTVIKQIGARGGGNDVPMFSDTTEVRNGVGVWSTGNTGVSGKFYAVVRRTPQCVSDTSPTVVIPEK